MFDLSKPTDAYLFGLLQTDGHHQGSVNGKGKVAIELSASDAELLYSIQSLLPCYASVKFRTRTTNFSGGSSYTTATLAFFAQSARRSLAELGLPPGPKSRTTTPPHPGIAQRHYV